MRSMIGLCLLLGCAPTLPADVLNEPDAADVRPPDGAAPDAPGVKLPPSDAPTPLPDQPAPLPDSAAPDVPVVERDAGAPADVPVALPRDAAPDAPPDIPAGGCLTGEDCAPLSPWLCLGASPARAVYGRCTCTPQAPGAMVPPADCARADTDCDGTPDPFLHLCDTRCVDTRTDAANCGACGNACAAGSTCVDGACVCPAVGHTLCSNGCYPLNDRVSLCTYCGRYCFGAGARPSCCPIACAARCGA